MNAITVFVNRSINDVLSSILIFCVSSLHCIQYLHLGFQTGLILRSFAYIAACYSADLNWERDEEVVELETETKIQ